MVSVLEAHIRKEGVTKEAAADFVKGLIMIHGNFVELLDVLLGVGEE